MINLKGRIVSLRDFGKFAFGHIFSKDVYIQFQIFDPEFIKTIKVGDFISINGSIGKSKTDEDTLIGESYELLLKTENNLPPINGFQDSELQVRYKFINYIRDESIQKNIQLRFDIIRIIKEFFIQEGYQEVETPILQNIASGASATPFKTYHEALNEPLYLRIAPELFLKRFLVSGFNKVFEIAKCFRNEGMDQSHLQEFTMLEAYEAYISYEDLMNKCINLIQYIFKKLNKNPPKFDIISWSELMNKYNIDVDNTEKELKNIANNYSISYEENLNKKEMLELLYKKLGLKNLTNPTLIYNYPKSPLSKSDSKDPRFSNQFQIIFKGFEIVKSCLEENSWESQLNSFLEEEKIQKTENDEIVRTDLEFIEALKYGMPPSGGLGVGIDRLIMIINDNNSIKDSILFPLLRIKK